MNYKFINPITNRRNPGKGIREKFCKISKNWFKIIYWWKMKFKDDGKSKVFISIDDKYVDIFVLKEHIELDLKRYYQIK